MNLVADSRLHRWAVFRPKKPVEMQGKLTPRKVFGPYGSLAHQ